MKSSSVTGAPAAVTPSLAGAGPTARKRKDSPAKDDSQADCARLRVSPAADAPPFSSASVATTGPGALATAVLDAAAPGPARSVAPPRPVDPSTSVQSLDLAALHLASLQLMKDLGEVYSSGGVRTGACYSEPVGQIARAAFDALVCACADGDTERAGNVVRNFHALIWTLRPDGQGCYEAPQPGAFAHLAGNRVALQGIVIGTTPGDEGVSVRIFFPDTVLAGPVLDILAGKHRGFAKHRSIGIGDYFRNDCTLKEGIEDFDDSREGEKQIIPPECRPALYKMDSKYGCAETKSSGPSKEGKGNALTLVLEGKGYGLPSIELDGGPDAPGHAASTSQDRGGTPEFFLPEPLPESR